MSAVYRVFGQRGEYSDFNEWSLRAFTDEAEAGRFKVACELEVARVRRETETIDNGGDPFGSVAWKKKETIVSKFDPSVTGERVYSSYPTTYGVEKIEVGWPK